MSLLKLENFTVWREDKTVLRNVNLAIEQGEMVALKGPSGCGKSTLLKSLLGGCRWQADLYQFGDVTVQPGSIHNVRTRTGYIGQEAPLSGVSVRAALMQPFLFSAYQSRSFPEKKMAQLLEKFLLPHQILQQHPSNISGGQRQRLAIIRVLLLEPELLVADEPTSALDGESRAAVISELINTHRTVISTSHDDHWLSACHRIITLSDGQIIGEAENVQYS